MEATEMTDFDTHWLDLPIGRLRVRTRGTGPALIFTHGVVVDGRIWDRVATEVSEHGFQVILPDLPLGAHTVPVKDRSTLTTSSVATSLFDIADALDVQRFSIIGFDTGGAISQVAVAAQPERFDRLALMSCDAFEHYPPLLIKPIKWAASWSPATTLVLKTLSHPRYQRTPLPLALVAKHKIAPELIAAWSSPCAMLPDVRADFVAFVKQMNSTDTLAAAEKLKKFPGPSMVLWSRKDRVFPRRDAHRLAELLPNCELRWIDDAFTFASLDNPKRVTELVLEFMAMPLHK
jgi:pimeloyl-ACP methyl ester carboxylesterase